MSDEPAASRGWERRRDAALAFVLAVGAASGLARCGFRIGDAADTAWLWVLASASCLAAAGVAHRAVAAASKSGAIGGALLAALATLLVWRLVSPESAAGSAAHAARLDLLLPALFLVLATREVVLRAVAWMRERVHRGVGAPVTPAQIFLLSFLVLIVLGALALMLPRSRVDGTDPIGLVDAFFASTSAVCVTGLTTFDVGSRLSMGGQGILLALIQLGGLGIMTYGAFFSLLLGRGMAISEQAVMREMVTSRFAAELQKAVLAIVGLTLSLEVAGAGLLYLAGIESTGGRVWASAFHAVSAFCNAGFALWPANLMAFDRQPVVLGTVAALVVAGGLGFTVLIDLGGWIARRRVGDLPPRFSRLALHTRVVVLASGGLLVLGALGFLACEWNGALAGYGLVDRLTNALFHSAISRTAGFNALDIGRIGEPGLLWTMALMFVGASPASTGGGIKTTTLVVLMAAVRALAANRESVHVLGRSLPARVVKTALVLFALGAAAVFAGTFVLSLLEPGIPAIQLAFETVSALGTVGLSTGITPKLSSASKVVLCVLMFVGRVGPVTLLFSMAGAARPVRYEYAEEDVIVG